MECSIFQIIQLDVSPVEVLTDADDPQDLSSATEEAQVNEIDPVQDSEFLQDVSYDEVLPDSSATTLSSRSDSQIKKAFNIKECKVVIQPLQDSEIKKAVSSNEVQKRILRPRPPRTVKPAVEWINPIWKDISRPGLSFKITILSLSNVQMKNYVLGYQI